MRKTALLAVALLGFCGDPALAQHPGYDHPSTAGEITPRAYEEALDAVRVRQGMLKIGWCVAGRHPREAQALVLDATKLSNEFVKKILDSDCLLVAVQGSETVTLTTHPPDVRYAVAEALIQRTLARFNPAEIRNAAPLSVPSLSSPEAARVGAYIALDAFGECVVRANAHGSWMLLKTRPGRKEETDALQALMPSFRGCLTQGRDFRADVTTLRGTIAVNYYRLATAPKLPSKPERGA